MQCVVSHRATNNHNLEIDILSAFAFVYQATTTRYTWTESDQVSRHIMHVHMVNCSDIQAMCYLLSLLSSTGKDVYCTQINDRFKQFISRRYVVTKIIFTTVDGERSRLGTMNS